MYNMYWQQDQACKKLGTENGTQNAKMCMWVPLSVKKAVGWQNSTILLNQQNIHTGYEKQNTDNLVHYFATSGVL